MTAALCSTVISPLSSATWWPSLVRLAVSQAAILRVWKQRLHCHTQITELTYARKRFYVPIQNMLNALRLTYQDVPLCLVIFCGMQASMTFWIFQPTILCAVKKCQMTAICAPDRIQFPFTSVLFCRLWRSRCNVRAKKYDKRLLSQQDLEKLVHAFILSRLDNSNSVFTGLPVKSSDTLLLDSSLTPRKWITSL